MKGGPGGVDHVNGGAYVAVRAGERAIKRINVECIVTRKA